MPPAFLIMKLTISGVTSCAAQMRSPSFSRSSSSATMTNLPVADVGDRLFYRSEDHDRFLEQTLNVLPEHVGLDVHVIADREVAERGVPQRVFNQRQLQRRRAPAGRSP